MQSYAVGDSYGIMGVVNWDLAYTNGTTRSPTSSTERDNITLRLTTGVDRNGDSLKNNGGFVSSLTASYTDESSTGTDSKLGETTDRNTEGFRVQATGGYTSGTNASGRSYGVNSGLEFSREVVRRGGVIESTTDNQEFRIGAEFNEQWLRGSASCNAGERTTQNAMGVNSEDEHGCHLTLVRRF